MNKLTVVIALIGLLGGGGFLFRSKISDYFFENKDKVIDYAIKKVSEKYNIPGNVQNDIQNISKKMDPQLLKDFLKDPQGFFAGKSEKTMEFMKTAEGKQLMGYFNKYMKDSGKKE